MMENQRCEEMQDIAFDPMQPFIYQLSAASSYVFRLAFIDDFTTCESSWVNAPGFNT